MYPISLVRWHNASRNHASCRHWNGSAGVTAQARGWSLTGAFLKSQFLPLDRCGLPEKRIVGCTSFTGRWAGRVLGCDGIVKWDRTAGQADLRKECDWKTNHITTKRSNQ